jgi:hypothetical protein
MECIENLFWPETLPVMEDFCEPTTIEGNIIPLITDATTLDSCEVVAFMHRGTGIFKLLDSFSLESRFAINAIINPDGTKVRFLHQLDRHNTRRYCGTVFINSDGSIFYRKSAKSLDSIYIHELLGNFFYCLHRGKATDVGFVPC